MITVLGKNYLFQKFRWAVAQRLIDAAGSLFFGPKETPLPEVKKILISRIDHIGDVFLASSILPHLKAAFPKAEMHFMVGQWAVCCIRHNPAVDKILVYNALRHNRSGNLIRNAIEAFKGFFSNVIHMRNEGYDLCIDLRAYPFNSIPLLFLGKGKYKVGFDTGGYGFLLDKIIPYRRGVHELAHVQDALRAIGVDAPVRAIKPEFKVLDTAEQESERVLLATGIQVKEPFILLHTGSGNIYKLWEKERWQDLIDTIRREYRIKIVACDPVYGDLMGCLKLSSMLPLELFAAVAKRSELFLGLDSLPAHLAASFGTPVISVWCGINDSVQWRPIGENVSIVKKDMSCSPCLRKKGCRSMECMDISVEDCMKEVRKYLGSSIFEQGTAGLLEGI